MLAGKCNDEPRHCLSLTAEVLKQYYGKETIRKVFASKEYQDEVIEHVQNAELVLMFTLEFDFDVTPLVADTWKFVKDIPCLRHLRDNHDFQQFLISTSNDVMKRDVKMILQFRSLDIALANCQLFFKVWKQEGNQVEEPLPDPETGAHWYVAHGLSEEIHQQISARFYKLYANVQQVEAGAVAAPGADSIGFTETAAGRTVSVGAASSGEVGGARSTAAAPAASIPSAMMGMAPRKPPSAVESTAEQPKIVSTGAAAGVALGAGARALPPARAAVSSGGGATGAPAAGGGRRMISMGLKASPATVAPLPLPPPQQQPVSTKRPRSTWEEEEIPHSQSGPGWGSARVNYDLPPQKQSMGGGYSQPRAHSQQPTYSQERHPALQQQQQSYRPKPPASNTNYSPYSLKPSSQQPRPGNVPSIPRAVPKVAPVAAPDSDKGEGELEEGEIF